MNKSTKKINKILLIILITLMGIATISNATSCLDYTLNSQLAEAASAATRGEENDYFTFDATSMIGKSIYASDAVAGDPTDPYDHVGEYCIDARAGVGGTRVYTVMNIVDITPDGTVIIYGMNSQRIETTDETVVNEVKSLAYSSIQSINQSETRISGNESWKVTIAGIISANTEILNLDACLRVPMDAGNVAKKDEARSASRDKAYTGRFIFLYGHGGQNQIIFGAKEGEARGDLEIIKTGGGNKALERVGFQLQYNKTGEWVSNPNNEEKSEYYADRGMATTFYTDEIGKAIIKGLLSGDYTLYETVNPNYGYICDSSQGISVITVKSGSNTRNISNTQVYVKLSGYVWVDKIDGKDSQRNNLYKTSSDSLQDTNDILFNGITVRLKDRTTGETVKKTVTSKLNRYKDSVNDGNGEYLFMDVLIEKLKDYYIEFEYDGLTYTNVIPHIEQDRGSKSAEGEEGRDNFNKNFSRVEGKTRDTGFTRDANGNEKHALSYNISETGHQATLINNGQYTITANTDVVDYKIKEHFVDGEEEIKYINLGLYEREQPDIALQKDIKNVKLTINGYEHVYEYAQRYLNAGEYGDGFNVGVKFGDKYAGMAYTRAVYKADYEYINEKDKSKELKVYVTYQIAIANQSDNLTAQVNSIADYFDSRYEIVKAGTGVDEKGNIIGNFEHEETNYNEKYQKSIIHNNTRIEPKKVESVYVQFAFNREAVIEILNDRETLNNVVEINSYSIYSNNKIYAGIDVDSAPGNCIPGDGRTSEDDTDSSPSLTLEVADARELTGKVFLDETSGELMTGRVRQGSGAYEEGEKGIKDVDITFTENTGSGEVKTAKTNENGDFYISDYIPGDYTLTYTWGDKTYTVQDYKGTVYDSRRDQTNKKWYKENVATRLSDAMDNYQTRLEIDEELKRVINSTVTTKEKMDATTPTMGIGVEYETTYTASMGARYTYRVENVDFGIVERARQDLAISKRVKTLKATLANGQVIVDLTIEEDEKGNRTIIGNRNNVTYMKPDANTQLGNGFVRLELDNELIQGTTLEVGYEIRATNQSELDYLSEKFYHYGIQEGDLATIEPTGVIDYLDGNWALDTEKYPQWQTKTLEEVKGLLANTVYDSEDSTIRNKKILYTESLKGQKLKPTETKAIDLTVSKILTTSDEISLDNETELVELNKTGGAKPESVPGNYIPGTASTETDDGMAETTIVTPATGENQNYILPVMVGVTAFVILGVGIIIIKKKVIE